MNVETKKAEAEVLAAAEDRGTPLLVLLILFVMMLFAGLVYMDIHAGGFSPLVYAPYRDLKHVAGSHPLAPGGADLAKGLAVYSMSCQPCHQQNGLGSPSQAPPLAGSDWVNEKNPARLIRIPLKGLTGPITVSGQAWTAVPSMPAQGEGLSDEDLSALLSYIRQAWGNKAPQVTAAQVKQVRQEISGHSGPFTPDQLKAVPVD